MIRCCGIEEEDDNEMKREVLRIEKLAPSQYGISNSQLAHSTLDQSCCVWLQVAGVSHRPTSCSELVRCCLYINNDR